MKRRNLIAFFAPVAAGFLAAPAVLLAQTDPVEVYKQGENDYAIYRYPALARTTSDTLIACAEARKAKDSGWNASDIFMRVSKDGGATWSDAAKLGIAPDDIKDNPVSFELDRAQAKEGEIAIHNPTVVTTKEGAALFLYGVEYNRFFLRTADAAGENLSDPVEITSVFEEFRPEFDWRVAAPGPGAGTQLDSGRLVVPVWLSKGIHGMGFQPAVVATIYSDDAGATWKRGDIVAVDLEVEGTKTGTKVDKCFEATVAQSKDGTVVINIRNKAIASGFQTLRAQATSKDGATGWSEVTFVDGLMEPICHASMIGTEAGLVFSNPANMIMRRDLKARVSTDNGATWSDGKPIAEGVAGYSCLAAGEGDAVYVLYESGANMTEREPASILFRGFTTSWLTE